MDFKVKIGLYSLNPDLFDNQSGRDGYNYRWYALQKEFIKQNNELVTFNVFNAESEYDVVIENGIQSFAHPNKYLLMIESPHVRPQDWNLRKHTDYKKIFTWDDGLVDNKIYFKLNYAFDIPSSIPKLFANKKLCCTIAGNKSADHPDELYSKRVELIRWFEHYHINDFDLYGTKWDEYRFGFSFLGRFLNKIKFLKKQNHFPSYKGLVDSKFETMQKYKFAICYENIKDQPGYITEKIFDCLFAGCVPVYWGANNVSEYIPQECFIDKNDYKTFEELYEYMNGMDEVRYMKHLDAIETFLNSQQANPFRAKTFANTIVSEILKD